MTSTLTNSLIANDLYLNQALLPALEQIELNLKDFANSEEFVAKMRLAFGETFDLEAVLNLGNAWKNQDFSIIPAITILSSAELNGANGAFAATTNTIYLSQEFLTSHQGDVTDVTSVILEEIGHWVDNQINTVDSIGDEGAIFSALVQRESLSDEALGQLKAEDDLGAINLDGQVIKVEQNLSDFGGTIVWKDEQGGLHPVRGARVKAAAYVMSSDLPYDSNRNPGAGAYEPFTKDETQTDENGKYSFTIDPTSLGAKKGIAWYFWVYTEGLNRPNQTSIYENIYEKINHRIVDPRKATNLKPTGETYYFQSNGYTPVSSNQLNIAIPTSKTQTSGGNTTTIPDDAGRAFSVYDALYIGEKYYAEVTNTQLPELLVFLPPATLNLDSSKMYISDTPVLQALPSDWDQWDVILHEYGHHLAFKSELMNISTAKDGISSRGYDSIKPNGKVKGVSISWVEGLADYLSMAIQRVAFDQGLLSPNIPNVNASNPSGLPDTFITGTFGATKLRFSIENKLDPTQSDARFSIPKGEGDQASVSRVLWDIADDNSDSFSTGLTDKISVGHINLYKILDQISGLDTLWDVWKYFYDNPNKLGSGGINDNERIANLGAIFEEYGIAPQPTKTPSSSDKKLEFEWKIGNRYGSEGSGNDEFKILVFDKNFQKYFESSKLDELNLDKEDGSGGEWKFNEITNTASWTPTVEEAKKIKPGVNYLVITGSDTGPDVPTPGFGLAGRFSPDELTGPYWSGSHPFVVSSSLDQNAQQDNAFSFQIPTNTFTDIDAGDVLTYSATLENGNALPTWLTFNSTTRTFSGTPTNDNVGNLNIKAIATDKAGATVSDIFVITVENVNDAPIVANLIADQNAKQGTAFNFQIPTNTFTDIDAGDVLTYSATLENGNALPSWLTFNSTTRTFSGTPTNDNVGNLNIKAIATDKVGENVSDIFTITVENVNDAPTLANAIADQNAKQGNAFNFQIPSNTFTDIDAGDVLTYSATLENGNALPSWLTFNSTTHTFSGTPTNDNVSSLNVKAIATDKAGVSVSDIFAITVENVNDAPILSNVIVDQNAKQGTAFNFQIPTNTFTDIDAGDVLTYSATLENSNALPSWLTFNPTTRSFSGTPANDTVGNLNVKVAATDTIGAIATDTFTIKVQNVNTAPILKNPLLDQTVKVNSTFTFTLPKDTFSDPDAVNPYKNLVIFGDSLSDTGNAYKASGNTFPPSPNYQGRLSNGLIWVDYFAPDLQFTNPSIQNYAFLGANTGVSNTFGQITVPGLLTQIQQFKTVNTNSIGRDGLYVIWAGANDFLNLATDPTQAVTNAVTNISSAITTLAGLGAKEIVVGNLTDLGATPLSIANNNVANARAISIGFNAALNQALTNLEPALNVDLSLVDIFGLSTAFQTNPANYKFTNITQPLITVTTPVNPDQYAFWDDVHPTTRLHQLVTDTFKNTLLNDGVIPDLIKYSATLADGSNLPDWLNFNSTTRTFSGTPNIGNVGKLDVKVIATDKAGATVNDIFTLAVNQSTTVGTPGDDKLIATPGSQFDGQKNIVFTGAGKDEVDLSTVSAFPNSGNNIVDLGSGEDTIFVNKGDRAFGSDGNDTFDARDGQGGNRISGGISDDTFYLGSNDRALGGDGKDIFRVSLGGGNLISGGAGADQFWIVNAELPSSANTVLDFQLGTDVIGIQGAVSLGITTSTLKLNQVGGDTAIVFNNQTLATLTGIQASSLSLTDSKQFVFA